MIPRMTGFWFFRQVNCAEASLTRDHHFYDSSTFIYRQASVLPVGVLSLLEILTQCNDASLRLDGCLIFPTCLRESAFLTRSTMTAEIGTGLVLMVQVDLGVVHPGQVL